MSGVHFGAITSKKTFEEIRESVNNWKSRNPVDVNMTMEGSVVRPKTTKNTNKPTAAATTSNTLATFTQMADAIGKLNNTLANIKKTSPENTQKSSGNFSMNTVSDGGGSISDNGASMTGFAQNVNTNSFSSGYDMSSINQMSQSLNANPNLSINNLNQMKNQLSLSRVDITSQLSSAQADYSNIQGQLQTAETNVATLEGEVGTAQAERDGAKTTLDNNTSHMNSSIAARDTLDEQLGSVNEQYKSDCEAVKSQEQNKSAAQTEVSSAKAEKGQAEAGVASAEQALSSAESTLANTPETLEDGSPNPAYETAQAAVDAAKAQKEQADKALETANKSLESAQQKLETVEQNLQQAQQTKQATLEKLQQTDSKYKDMAQKCEQMQHTVEQNQKNYDQSLKVYDDTNANYERLNAELESQQGIINQLEVYEAKLDNLKTANNQIKELNANIDKKLQAKQTMTNEMLQNAQATEGCSAFKTPAENLLSMKDGNKAMSDFSRTAKEGFGNFMDVSQMKAYDGRNVINEDASFFEKSGCIANSDGSYTNSENGITWVDLGSNTWVRTDTLDSNSEYRDKALEKYPQLADTNNRANAQNADYGTEGLLANRNLRHFNNKLRWH